MEAKLSRAEAPRYLKAPSPALAGVQPRQVGATCLAAALWAKADVKNHYLNTPICFSMNAVVSSMIRSTVSSVAPVLTVPQ